MFSSRVMKYVEVKTAISDASQNSHLAFGHKKSVTVTHGPFW